MKDDRTRLELDWLMASKQLISACMGSPGLIDEAWSVEPRHMYGSYSDVWESLRKCSINGAVDLKAVMDELPASWRGSSTLTGYGANDREQLVQELVHRTDEVIPTAAYVQTYIARLMECHRRNEDYTTGVNLARAARNESADLDAEESRAIDRLVRVDAANGAVTWMNEIGVQVLAELEHNIESPAELRGMQTGLDTLDKAVGGFEPEHYVLLGGRPSMGKSALAFRIARGLAQQGRPGMALTSETSQRMFVIRLACSQVGVNYQREFKTGKLASGNEFKLGPDGERVPTWDALRTAIAGLSTLPIAHVSAHNTPQQLYALAHRMKRAHGIEWFLIDTINLLRGDSYSNSGHREMTDKSAQLALIAHELNILTIATWQLSRSVESTSDKVPTMDSLRESGSGEEHADVLLLAYRPAYYKDMGKTCRDRLPNGEEIGNDEMAVIVAKNRDGQNAYWARLAFDRQYARVTNRRVD